MARRILHLLLCGMAIVQLGAVPPCFLDESASAVWGVDGAAVKPGNNDSGPRVWHDEDQDDPRFAAIRAGAVEPQASVPNDLRDAIPFLTASFHSQNLLIAMPVRLTAHRLYDAGPPPDGIIAALNLPLLI